MHIREDDIIKGVRPDELVRVTEVKKRRHRISICYENIRTKQLDNRRLSPEDMEGWEVVANAKQFFFTGDAYKFKLYAEAERIRNAFQYDPLFAVNCSIVDPLPHQVEAVYKALLPLPQIRFLLADDTGAGKTIMAGLLLKELLIREIVKRVLIITPGGLTKQWQEDELSLKFNLHFTLVDRNAFRSEPNIFTSKNLIVTSMDFIRNDDVNKVLKDTAWDLLIVDEAHKLSAYELGRKKKVSKRYRAVKEIIDQCEHRLLLTATPHRGREDTFKYLLQLLDQDVFASDDLVTTRIKDIQKNGYNKFFIRRLKEDMKSWDKKPLFKKRSTRTVKYKLTQEEKILYDKVTAYLSSKKTEAKKDKNTHVTLALMVMQRRLVSSIFAINKTLKKRYDALSDVLNMVQKNISILKEKDRLRELEVKNLESYDELTDEEKQKLEKIMADPKRFKLFTTAKDVKQLEAETQQLHELYTLSNNLFQSQAKERKLESLEELLNDSSVLRKDEKLVIFTEHKDTLDYLEKRLTESGGYKVVNIHGGKSVDERRTAQREFANDAQILIATDAAAEGINLQFCRLLINWDIPWNPNRLEQRMGRIHRYGQKEDVLVCNLVAEGTREGKVLEKLLAKLEKAREQLGDDKVYDVISDVVHNIGLDDITNAIFNHERRGNEFNAWLNEDYEETTAEFKEAIEKHESSLGTSEIDYQHAEELKNNSDERRLQPYYIKEFFHAAFTLLGGELEEIQESVFKIKQCPKEILTSIDKDYRIRFDWENTSCCFDKKIFLDLKRAPKSGKILYASPGNYLFDTLLKEVQRHCQEDMFRGCVLVSPEDTRPFYAFLAKTQIIFDHSDKIADEKLSLICQDAQDEGQIIVTKLDKLLDFGEPQKLNIVPEALSPKEKEKIIEWADEHILEEQEEEVVPRLKADIQQRMDYLKQAFEEVIWDIQEEILTIEKKEFTKALSNSDKQKLIRKEKRLTFLKERRIERQKQLEDRMMFQPKLPEILGGAYVIPLSDIQYERHFGMRRDTEVERIAMETVMAYERKKGRIPEDVSAKNLGYDIRSEDGMGRKRYIEVKGRAQAKQDVMLSKNEWLRLAQLEDKAWLYIVENCKQTPTLYRIQNPANTLEGKQISKDIQYLCKYADWQKHRDS